MKPVSGEHPQQHLPLWAVICLVLANTVLILLLFSAAKFLPGLLSGTPARPAAAVTAEPAAAAPVSEPDPEPAAVPEDASASQAAVIDTPVPAAETLAPTPSPTPTPTPTPTPDLRTPWQIRFADRFSEEPVLTDHSYTSPLLSVDIRTETRSVSYGRTAVCHIADIYLSSPDQFRTCTANGEMSYFSVQDHVDMDIASHAVLSISGDCYSFQQYGFLMRNGQLYMDDVPYNDILVLYSDGSMAAYSRGQYTVDEVVADGAVQVWCFGPSLLDADGHAKPYYETTSVTVNQHNPRCAIGYYEPGHYCFVVVDGRQAGYSDGILLPELAQLFEELGCRMAYNLDGGGTAVMYFCHEPFSRQSNGADRQIGDIVYITEEGFE